MAVRLNPRPPSLSFLVHTLICSSLFVNSGAGLRLGVWRCRRNGSEDHLNEINDPGGGKLLCVIWKSAVFTPFATSFILPQCCDDVFLLFLGLEFFLFLMYIARILVLRV
ncbi:hypothetical protein NEOLEDRAFT_228054 [Neolentinus lepideus HHB14362 ss-1]|uniref:Uncharacterized protein n=1 Tax=Neolentinus lepideus HHB14362 ss-1 TaxID=1314782 RepID=A0A165TE46_9AGAM|nr:hypothetical protein NEOLEDRAFT_228054 [Neolentinus lepideus HHB14362 ss-1]